MKYIYFIVLFIFASISASCQVETKLKLQQVDATTATNGQILKKISGDWAPSDEQQISLSGNTLTLEDGGTVDLTPYLDTDNQTITDFSLTGTTLSITLENGNTETVELLGLGEQWAETSTTLSTTKNVGIGVISPTEKLEVNGNIKTAFNSYIQMLTTGAAGSGGYIQSTGVPNSIQGYGMWLNHNAKFDGTSWVQPRGTLASTMFTSNHHLGWKFLVADANGTNDGVITPIQAAVINRDGSAVFNGTVSAADPVAATDLVTKQYLETNTIKHFISLPVMGSFITSLSVGTTYGYGIGQIVIPSHCDGYTLAEVTYMGNTPDIGTVAISIYDASSGLTTNGFMSASWLGLSTVYQTVTGGFTVGTGDRIILQAKATTGTMDIARFAASIVLEE